MHLCLKGVSEIVAGLEWENCRIGETGEVGVEQTVVRTCHTLLACLGTHSWPRELEPGGACVVKGILFSRVRSSRLYSSESCSLICQTGLVMCNP